MRKYFFMLSDKILLPENKDGQDQNKAGVSYAVNRGVEEKLCGNRQSIDDFCLEVKIFQVRENGIKNLCQDLPRTCRHLFDQGFQTP